MPTWSNVPVTITIVGCGDGLNGSNEVEGHTVLTHSSPCEFEVVKICNAHHGPWTSPQPKLNRQNLYLNVPFRNSNTCKRARHFLSCFIPRHVLESLTRTTCSASSHYETTYLIALQKACLLHEGTPVRTHSPQIGLPALAFSCP